MNSPRFRPASLALLLVLGPLAAFPLRARAAEDAGALQAGFARPPASAAPRTWWHWISGNISREGITADLEAMKAIGVGGAQLFTVDQSEVKGPVVFMSPQWRQLVGYAISESDRLGLELAMENCEGWSESGGPWVRPAQSMQEVVWSQKRIEGGRTLDVSDLGLPQPLTIRGYYQDIALFAYPTPPGYDDGSGARITTSAAPAGATLPVTLPAPTPGDPQWIRFEFPEERTFGSFRFATPIPLRDNTGVPWELQASDDGANYRTVYFVNPHLSAAFPPARGRFFRLWIPSLPPRATELTFTELALGGPSLDRPEAWSGMAVDLTINQFRPNNYPAQAAIRPQDLVDLTGRERWNAPPGAWTLLRIGHTSTGITNHPASPATVGLECDKLSAAAVEAHLTEGSVGAVMADSPQEMGRGLRYLLCDSWEAGCENWTPLMREDFRKRWGYDLEPWLPVLTGQVVGSVEESERFLWDYRRLLADLVAENHYGVIQRFAHQHGMGLYAEAVGINMPTVADQLQCKGRTDIPMGEFWVGQDWPGQTPYDDSKEAASAAHIYGQNIAADEAYTARAEFGGWAKDPYSLKALGDLEFCLGINRLVFHRYAHQPWLDRKPGMSMGPWGTNFERTNTWWNDASAWMTYLSRCQYLLQQGRFAADLCYFYGEGAPVDVSVDGLTPRPPSGYDYDVCNAEILARMAVKDGRIVLPSGMSYRVLVLPDDERMSAWVARKVRELVEAGATVVGPRPARSPSLADYPAGDKQVESIAAEVWGDCDGRAVTEHRFGAGRVVWGRPLAEVVGAPPDFSSPDRELRFIHRHTAAADIYFVSNQDYREATALCTFRQDSAPELWHPNSGRTERPASYTAGPEGATVTLPIHFDPAGSIFVVFPAASAAGRSDPVVAMSESRQGALTMNPAGPSASLPVLVGDQVVVTEWAPITFEFRLRSGRRLEAPAASLPAPLSLEGPWTVAFPPNLGAPPRIVLPRLESWTASPVDGVKFFSGTATYERTVDLPAAFFGEGRRQMLDLGQVENLARVRCNGRDLGILWKEPFRADLTGAARPGLNRIEIEVTNLWPNRMIGDAYLPASQRITWASYSPYRQGSPLLPSGLIGPVLIRPGADIVGRAKDD